MKTTDILKIVMASILLGVSPAYCAEDAVVNGLQTPEVACRYETKIHSHGQTKGGDIDTSWYFWRKADVIQTRDADGDHGEIWERTGNGSIQYRKLYHDYKTAVEYMPADMPTNNKNFDWFKLSHMLSREELDSLKLVKKAQVLGHNAELHQGMLGDQSVDVVWLPEAQIPASITRKDKNGSVQLSLVEITPLTQAAKQPFSQEVLADYRHIDAVDFGDMENDPIVKKIMAEEGGHHHHH